MAHKPHSPERHLRSPHWYRKHNRVQASVQSGAEQTRRKLNPILEEVEQLRMSGKIVEAREWLELRLQENSHDEDALVELARIERTDGNAGKSFQLLTDILDEHTDAPASHYDEWYDVGLEAGEQNAMEHSIEHWIQQNARKHKKHLQRLSMNLAEREGIPTGNIARSKVHTTEAKHIAPIDRVAARVSGWCKQLWKGED